MSLNEFVRQCSDEAMATLLEALEHRASEYVSEGTSVAIAGGKDWKLRSVGQHMMGTAMTTLAEELKQEKEQVQSWRSR